VSKFFKATHPGKKGARRGRAVSRTKDIKREHAGVKAPRKKKKIKRQKKRKKK
jgi:hypothetical protein